MAAGRKQVTFDLNTKALKVFYPSESWNGAYGVIKRHMRSNGFLWQQGSVYVSKKPMLSRDVSTVLAMLVDKHPWLNVCMRDCRQTNIGREYSQNYLFDKNAHVLTREETKKVELRTDADKMTLSSAKKHIAEMKCSMPSMKTTKDDKHVSKKIETARGK